MSWSTKFMPNPISGLPGNAWKLLGQSNAMKRQECSRSQPNVNKPGGGPQLWWETINTFTAGWLKVKIEIDILVSFNNNLKKILHMKESKFYCFNNDPIIQQQPSCYWASQMNLCQSGWLPNSFLRSITSSVACCLLIQVVSYTQLWTVNTTGSMGKIRIQRYCHKAWHQQISFCI